MLSRAAAELVVSLSRSAKASGQVRRRTLGRHNAEAALFTPRIATLSRRDRLAFSARVLGRRALRARRTTARVISNLCRTRSCPKSRCPAGTFTGSSEKRVRSARRRMYEEELRSFFGQGSFPVFDLILLGAGEDGHTASLFPGAPALLERTRLAVPVHFDAPKLSRVTLTLPVLTNAAQVIFLVAGRAKAAVVHEILEDGNPKQYPAGMVQPVRGRVTWMLGRDATRL